jgi:hypothetical protein
MKAQIPMIEAVISIIIILTTFSIFFPGFTYQSKWQEATILLKSRDILITLDRLGKIWNFSFVEDMSYFMDSVVEPNMLYWKETDGTFKQRIVVACNCTLEQIGELTRWIGKIKLNEREISLDFVQAKLDNIPQSDVLLIFGYKNLDAYRNNLLEYLKNENGIVEIADFDSPVENAQKEIFGIVDSGSWSIVDYDRTIKPLNASNITYQLYKIFYHLPLLLRTPTKEISIPTEGLASPTCPNVTSGNFTFNQTAKKFWVCNSTHVYFDTNQNSLADLVVKLNEDFVLQGYKFHLNYINNYTDIGISFRPFYNFTDKDTFQFCREPSKRRITPLNNENERAFLYGVKQTVWGEDVRSFCVIVNASGKAIWFTDPTNTIALEDDHKLLLASLLLAASNKRALQMPYPGLRIGYLTPYINVKNKDMFEVYKFNLGLGYPY